jgi:hypothetical protein
LSQQGVCHSELVEESHDPHQATFAGFFDKLRMTHGSYAVSLLDHFLNEDDILVRCPAALILSEKHVTQLDEIREQWRVMVGPIAVRFQFRLDAPDPAKLDRTHLALPALLGHHFPIVLITHRPLADNAAPLF